MIFKATVFKREEREETWPRGLGVGIMLKTKANCTELNTNLKKMLKSKLFIN